MAPRCRVVGAEPAKADDAYRSFRSGSRQSVTVPATIADGLARIDRSVEFRATATYVDDVVTVTEQEIVNAMRIVLQDLKLLIEPSSAVAVAALLAGKLGSSGQRVGIILSGGNVDLEQCPFLRGEATENDRGSCNPQRRLSLRRRCLRSRRPRENYRQRLQLLDLRMSGYLHLIVPRSRFRLLQGADVAEPSTNSTPGPHAICSAADAA